MSILFFLMGLSNYCNAEIFMPANMSEKNRQLFKSITKRQRKKFMDKKNVPLPVLEILWNMGFLPGDNPPKTGMNVQSLLNYLRIDINQDEKYRDAKNRALGILLHDAIERDENPEPEFGDEKFVRSGGKFIPISHLRTIPGTIFR